MDLTACFQGTPTNVDLRKDLQASSDRTLSGNRILERIQLV